MLVALALAFGLAMDATAVAAARGILARRSEAVILPLLFGGFQAGMAALGWLAAYAGGELFAAWDHWVAFALLAAVGGKMMIEAWRSRGQPAPAGDVPGTRRARIGLYLMLSIATSIDAAAAGVTLPALAVHPALTLGLIGVVTLACSALGYALGRRAGAHLGPRLELLGGAILVGLGVRVLVEHL